MFVCTKQKYLCYDVLKDNEFTVLCYVLSLPHVMVHVLPLFPHSSPIPNHADLTQQCQNVIAPYFVLPLPSVPDCVNINRTVGERDIDINFSEPGILTLDTRNI